MTSLLEQYPHRERFRLSKDGAPAETVYLPVHVHKYDWALLSGVGQLGALEQVLAPEDLEPSEMQPGSGLNVGLFAINYRHSDVGPFREYYLVIAAREQVIVASTTQQRPLGLFVWGIQLDSDLAIRCGRQIWGHPKTVCHGDVNSRGPDFEFRFTETNGQSIVWGRCSGTQQLAYSRIRFPSFFFITPYEIRRSWAEAINEGNSASRPFDPSRDELGWNPESAMGHKLTQVDFRPTHWTLARDMSAVALR